MPSTTTSSVVLTPNYCASQDGAASNYQSCWLGGNQDTLTFSTHGHETWHMWRFKIGAGWPYGPYEGTFPPMFQPSSNYQGLWGRMFNFHNTAEEPYLWNVIGASAVAIDFIHGVLVIHSEPANNTDWRISPSTVTKDVWHTVILNAVWGRTDGTTARPGRLTVWYDGADTPVVNQSNINTIYRYNDGSGFQNQRGFYIWSGFYTKALKEGYTLPFEMSYMRWGTTLAQTLADSDGGTGGTAIWPTSPPPAVAWALSNVYRGSGSTALGPGTVTKIADTTDSDYLIPPSLGGPSAEPGNTSVPTIDDTTPTNGQTLTRQVGTWTGSPTSYAYQWLLETSAGSGVYANIAGANATTYVVQAGDIGRKIKVTETATNSFGSTAATSAATSAVSSGATVTFGNTDGSDTGAMGADGLRGSVFQAPQNIDVTSASFYLAGNIGLGSGTANLKAVIYAMGNAPTSGGLPTTLLGTSGQESVLYSDVAGWVTFTFSTAVTVASGSWYLLGLHTGGTGSAALLTRLPTGGYFHFKSDTYSDGPAATFGTPADSQPYNMVAYAEGTLTSSGTGPSPNPTPNLRRISVRDISVRTVG